LDGILKIVGIVGARPQFVKAAAVMRRLASKSQLQHVFIHTGQHYDENMSDIFFHELGLPKPDRHLGIGSGTHGAQTGRMLEAIEKTVAELAADWVLVYGDTNSTLAGALAAAKLHIRVAHVEAGLRSFNRRMPEEINRVLTDHASDLLFAPTQAAVANLKHEGIPDERIHCVGDVMYDAALYYGAKAERESLIIKNLALQPKQYVLATIHRAENTDDAERLRHIFDGLARAATEIPVVVPLHPRTREVLKRSGRLEQLSDQLLIVEPVGYLEMVMLEKHAQLIVTDSGGVQKEAFFYEVPCITLRHETEWVELVELGWNRLVPPTSADAILSGLQDMLGQRGSQASPYGDGNAAGKIADAIQEHFA
jgi:UDP-GlcNAc3NAcA epimerase